MRINYYGLIKNIRLFGTLVFALLTLAAAAQNFTGERVKRLVPALDNELTSWEIYRLDAAALHQVFLPNSETYTPIQLTLGDHNWPLQLTRSKLLAPGYQLQEITADGQRIQHPSTIRPLQGYLANGGGRVSLTLNTDFIYGVITDQSGEEWYVTPLWYTDPAASHDLFVVYPRSAVRPGQRLGTCETLLKEEARMEQHLHDESAHQGATPDALLACYELDLAIASDNSMLNKYFSVDGVENHNIGVINNVQGDYTSSFNHSIQFNIVIQVVSSSNPWNPNANANTYLVNFRTWGNNGGFGVPFDLGECWTATDFTGSTIGIAYVGAVCTSFKYHVLQDFTGNPEFLRCMTSHEIGHNFDCDHDACSSNEFIMCPSVSSSNEWSGTSVNSVNSFLPFLISTSGCLTPCNLGPPPTADFTFEPNPGCVGQPVQFTDGSSGNVSTRQWTFPGGSPATSTADNPTVTWNTPGVKNVTLTLNASTSSQAAITKQVTIVALPTANFTTIVSGTTVTFNAAGGNGTLYEWEFGDGTGEIGQSVQHTFTSGGNYAVTLTVSNSCGSAIRIQNVNTAPTPDFVADLNSGCAPFLVNFENLSSPNATSYQWQFPGGTPSSSSLANPSVVYQTPGTYSVTLTAINLAGSQSTTQTSYITVLGPPVVSFSSVVNGATATFTNSTTNATSYQWAFGDGTTSNLSTAVAHTYTNGGTYAVTLTASNDCGSTTLVRNVTIASVPLASFTATGASGCGPLTVQFNNNSTNATSYSWQFPGGTPATSTNASPTVVYNTPGTYSVTLTATSGNVSSTATQTNVVVVNGPPTAGFTASTSGLTASFSNTSVGATSYQWVFPDGSFVTTENPNYTFPASGLYVVTLTSTNTCGQNTASQAVTVLVPPTAGFNQTATTGCGPLTVQFTSTASADATALAWEFPGGSPGTSTSPNPTVVYATPGTYSATLIASNAAGSDTITKPNLVVVNGAPTSAAFSASTAGAVATFTNSSVGATSYSWNFGDNTNASVAANPSHTYANDGTYTVTLTATNACGSITSTQTVTIVTPPLAGFTAFNTSGCAPLTVSFTNQSSANTTGVSWQFAGGEPATSTELNPTVVYNTPGVYSVSLVASNAAGISSPFILVDIIVVSGPPTSAAFSATTAGALATFTNSSVGATSYSWNFGDGSPVSTATSPTHTYTTDGTYTVTLTASNFCGPVTTTQTVVITTPPTSNFTATATNGCAPLTVQFTSAASANTTGLAWQFPGGTPSTSTVANPVVVYNTPGTYSVVLTASNSVGAATATQTNYVTVGGAPTSAAFSATTAGALATFTNSAVGATSYSWNFGDNSAISNASNPTHTYAADGTYTVTLTAANNCGSITSTQTVVIVTPPTASFTSSSTSGCAPLTVQFTSAASANATTLAWEFPGGNPATSNDPNPVVVYATPGTYSVVLTASNSAGSATTTQTDLVQIGTVPTADFSSQVGGLSALFENASTGATSYVWDFGDNSSSTEPNPTHTYATTGTYFVVLTATNDCGSVNDTLKVEIAGTAPIALIGLEGTDKGCSPFTVQFVNESVGEQTAWSWVFPGGMPATSTELNPTVTYSTPGIYGATLIAVNLFGSDTLEQPALVEVIDAPTAGFTAAVGGTDGDVAFTNTSVGGLTYAWDFGDGALSNEENPTHTYAASGAYKVILVVQNACGSAVFEQTVDVTVVGTQTPDWASGMRLYPNPNAGQFTLEINNVAANTLECTLLNTLGQEMSREVLAAAQGRVTQVFDYRHLPAGVYFFRVRAGGGAVALRVVVQE